MVQSNTTSCYPVSQSQMMLLPQRSESIECCFICGARHAIWLLNSSPTTDNKPFFPFLQYQKPPLNANKLDYSGRCLACNVCYLFLMQQWKTYQENKTPILKRLYWLKRPSDEYNIVGSSGSEKCQNDMLSHRELENIPASASQHYHSSGSRLMDNPPDRKYAIEEEEEEKEKNTHNIRDELNDNYTCPLCSLKGTKKSMKYVLTVPQSSNNIPFYSRIILGKNRDAEISNREGRLLVCSMCHSELYRQWLEFEKLSISWHDREFIIDSKEIKAGGDNVVACYLCHDSFSRDSLSPVYCKKVGDNPFYPFLKNLPKSYNVIPVCEEGITYGCSKCKLFLNQQWDVFEEANVSQEERVYRIHPSQPPLILSELDADTSIACFICSAKDGVKHSKRIYCNPGANMNLSFLKSFPRNKDIFFCEETGETFVCVSCFNELKQHWMKYRSTLFVPGGRPESYIKGEITHKICELCNTMIAEDEVIDLNIHPTTKEGEYNENKPFFPILKEFVSAEDKSLLSSCRLCALNLLNQWSSFNKASKDNEDIPDKLERPYKHNEFFCYICNDSVSRERIGWEDIDNVKEGIEVKKSFLSVRFDKDIAICNQCKQDHVKIKVKLEADSTKPVTLAESVKEEKPEESASKAHPFINLSMQNTQEHSTPSSSSSSSSSNSNEGSFAAALRKLAQQAPDFPVPVIPRDRKTASPSLPTKGADVMPSGVIPRPSPRQQVPEDSGLTGETPSIMAPVKPHNSSLSNAEKQEMLIKDTYSRMHSREHGHHLKDMMGRHPNLPQIAPGSYPYPEREEHHHRRSQDQFESWSRKDHHHRRSQEQYEPYDREEHRRNPITSSSAVSLGTHSLKERPSSIIGLVHPQPNRKHHDEESINKSSAMNSMHYPSRNTTTAVRSLSPTELPRYGPFISPPKQHPHLGHGQESGRQRDGHRERGIPFDAINHVQREYPNHARHARLSEEIQFLHERPHPLERKERIPSRHVEEDLRRRGLDYRWAGLPPHHLDEQYRHHVGHEHAPFKEPLHGQVYVPQFHYGRDYPIPVEPYIGHAIPPNSDAIQHHRPPISPRLLDYYRRGEHGLAECTHNQFEAAERRVEDIKEKEWNNNAVRTSSIDSVKRQRRLEESRLEKDTHVHSPTEKRKECSREETCVTEDVPKITFFKGIESNFSKSPESNDTFQQPNSINSLLNAKLLPDSKTELAAASILANMNRISQSPCSGDVESSSGIENRMQSDKPIKIEDETQSNLEDDEASEEKLLYMVTLGLVSHQQKRALEDDYEQRRRERKFQKFQGQPKKRLKCESTEDSSVNSDTQPASELDFYSGPMTRYKQQFLQEQESLLEQIQRQNNSDSSEDATEDIKLLSSIENKGRNSSSPDISKKENNNDNVINKSGIVKPFSKNNPLGDSSDSVNNRLFPSRLLAILQDDQQKINSNKQSTSVDDLTQVQHQELVDGIKLLDDSLFGQRISETIADNNNFTRWPGIENVSNSYSTYISEYDSAQQELLNKYNELELESISLQKNRKNIQKNLVIYHNRSMDISDQRKELHQSVEGMHSNLRVIMNL